MSSWEDDEYHGRWHIFWKNFSICTYNVHTYRHLQNSGGIELLYEQQTAIVVKIIKTWQLRCNFKDDKH